MPPEGGQLPLENVPPPPAVAPDRRPPSTLSVTSLVTYARCPKQFYWSVVRPLPRRSSPAARLGTEVHRWIEQRAGRQLSLIEPEETDDSLDPDALPADAGVIARLKASFLASPWAKLDPQRVEAPFVLSLGNHVIRGRIDAVYERDGRMELVDFKTGRMATDDPAWGVQLHLYGLAAIDTWQADPTRLRTTYCCLRADGAPDVLTTDWDPDTAERTRDSLIATLDDLADERYRPTSGGWCRPCDFLDVCPAGRQEVYGETAAAP